MGLGHFLCKLHYHGCKKPHAYLCGRWFGYELWHENRWSSLLHLTVLLFFVMGVAGGFTWQSKSSVYFTQAADNNRLPTDSGLTWPSSWASLEAGAIPAWQVRQKHDGSGEVVIAFVAGGANGTFESLSNFTYSLNGGATWRVPTGGDASNTLNFDWGRQEEGYLSGELGWFTFRAKLEPNTKEVSTDQFRVRFTVQGSEGTRFSIASEPVTLDTKPPVWPDGLALTNLSDKVRLSWLPVVEDNFVSYTVWYGNDPGAVYRHDGKVYHFGPSYAVSLFDRETTYVEVPGKFSDKYLFQIEARDFFGNTVSSPTVRFGTAKEEVPSAPRLALSVIKQAPELGPLPDNTSAAQTTRVLSAREAQWCVSDHWPQYTDHYVLHGRGEKQLTALAPFNSGGVICLPEKNLKPNTVYDGRHVHAIGLTGLTSVAQNLPELVTWAEAPAMKSLTLLPPYAASIVIDTKNNPANTEYALLVSSPQFDPHISIYLGTNNSITTMPTWAKLSDFVEGRTDKTIVIQTLQPGSRYSISVKARNSLKVETALSSPITLATSDDLGRQYVLPAPTIKKTGPCPHGAKWCDPKAK